MERYTEKAWNEHKPQDGFDEWFVLMGEEGLPVRSNASLEALATDCIDDEGNIVAYYQDWCAVLRLRGTGDYVVPGEDFEAHLSSAHKDARDEIEKETAEEEGHKAYCQWLCR